MIGEVFREAHASLTGGHFGLTKTLGRIRLKYYLGWHGGRPPLTPTAVRCLRKKEVPKQDTTSPASAQDTWVADGKGSAGCGWSIPPHPHGKSARGGSDKARACLSATEAIL